MIAVYVLASIAILLGGAACYVAVKIKCEKRAERQGGFMSWSIQKRGLPAAVLAEVKADSGVPYMPDALPLLIEELLTKVEGSTVGPATVSLSTNGHVYQGFGEVHLVITRAEPDVAEAPKEEVPA